MCTISIAKYKGLEVSQIVQNIISIQVAVWTKFKFQQNTLTIFSLEYCSFYFHLL